MKKYKKCHKKERYAENKLIERCLVFISKLMLKLTAIIESSDSRRNESETE